MIFSRSGAVHEVEALINKSFGNPGKSGKSGKSEINN
jgi:hypothetical protein